MLAAVGLSVCVVRLPALASPQPPGARLLSPNNGGIDIPIKPTFSWSPWEDATKYQLDLASDSEFKQMVITATINATTYEYSGQLDYGTSYFWRVRAIEMPSQNIPSDWSSTFDFETKHSVQLLKPNGYNVPVNRAQFSWDHVSGLDATIYQIDFARDSEFNQIVASATATSTVYEYPGTLDYGTHYYWRVKIIEMRGQSVPPDWSWPLSFSTEPIPTPPSTEATSPSYGLQSPSTPLWIQIAIAIGVILVVSILVLVFKKKR
ncbi:MAG: hypothetical protein ABSF74_05685 [Dehalococcoidia bacterium]